jgi:lysophospholipid acyltransferase (LPLAT)-like uncharacterized protein
VSRGAYPWWMGPAAVLGAAVLWLLARTWRVEMREEPGYGEAMRAREPMLFAFWHARQLPLVWTHRDLGAAVLVSQHRDGELIVRILERFGFGPAARGSSTRGGEAALLAVRAAVQAGRLVGITPDGPRGPAERAKDGVVFLAGQLGVRVVPVGSAARHAWVLRSWDRFRIPRPFTRVCVTVGTPVAIDPGRDPETRARERARIEAAIVAVTADARARAGERA